MLIRIYAKDELGQYVAWHNVIPSIIRGDWTRVYTRVDFDKDCNDILSHPILIRSDLIYAVEPY